MLNHLSRHRPTDQDALWQNVPIGVLYLSLSGEILAANPTFCALIGHTESQLRQLGNPAISISEDAVIEAQTVQTLIAQNTPHTLQKRYRRRDGTIVWATVQMSLVDDSGDRYLLVFVTDLSDRRQAESAIQPHREREEQVNGIAAQRRSTLELPAILQIAVHQLRQALKTDRVVVYQFFPDYSGICLAESVGEVPAIQGQVVPAEYLSPPERVDDQAGTLWAIGEVQTTELAQGQHERLAQLQVRSLIAIGIASLDEQPPKREWGLLVVHCQHPRQWTADEQHLVQSVANQLAIALEQAIQLDELRHATQELEDRVQQRTRSLERALAFEQLSRRLTETLRDLDETQMLRAAVAGLGQTLAADACLASLYDPQTDRLTVQGEFWGDRLQGRSLVGQSFSLTDWAEQRDRLLQQQACLYRLSTAQSRFLNADPEQPPIATLEMSKLLCPIRDEQGLIGVLTVLKLHPLEFTAEETTLTEQVASQCTIALRQAYLYRQEHEQRLNAAHFRSFLQGAVNIFVEYDADLRYCSMNQTGLALLGLTAEEIIGKTNRELMGDAADAIELPLQQAIDHNVTVFISHWIPVAQGIRVFETVYAPILTLTGRVQSVIGICRDVTDYKQQWQQLETQNQQLTETTRLKEEFVATTSHELRTPLTSILGFSNVLLRESFGKLNPKQKDYLERIYESGQHLLALINDILDLSRLEADRLELELQPVFVLDICEGVIRLVQERAFNQGLRLELDIAPEIEWMVADPRRLKQMLLNLLANAVKFTQTGSVGLTVSYQVPPAFLHLSTAEPNQVAQSQETIYFLVWDTGIGIDATDQRSLFAPFSQIDSSIARQHQGSGLGLAITRKLAELHGGTISLSSSPQQGSKFLVALPVKRSRLA